jgi:type I restriction enzyme S subunit
MNYDPEERERFGLRYGDVVVSEGSASANAVGMPPCGETSCQRPSAPR